MFKKLLSNLPFNPSLIGQVTFYAKRLHRESALRRAGFIMMALAMVVQMFAVISPPESSLQASPNTDLISGGFSSKKEAVGHCNGNTQNFKKIMNHFGISCDAIANGTVTQIAPRDHGGKLYSMGRLAYGVKGETPVRVSGVGTLYVRHFWSLNKEPSYKAIKVKDSQGKTQYILFSCGNLVSIGVPTPPPPTDHCPNIDGIQKKDNDCDVCPNKPGVQLKKEQCDVCPNKSGVQKDKTECDVCPNVSGVQTTKNQCDMCPNKDGIQNSSLECDVCPNKSGVQKTEDECDVCPAVDGVQFSEEECKPCEESNDPDDATACLGFQKAAKNTTQNVGDANGTTAKPDDVIEYTLTTTNTSKITIKDYVVSDGFADVLDYADIVDLHGGTLGEYGLVTWPKQELKPGQSVLHKVTVRIKSVLPSTPASSSDPEHFNMVMTNVYGNAIEIKLPPTITKTTEIVTTQLPNTGPGTSLVIGFTLTTVIAYFFARSRLLAKELDVVRADFGAVGGY